jgi:hypothetical protein
VAVHLTRLCQSGRVRPARTTPSAM